MSNTTLYRITAKDILWSDCPPVTIAFIAENRGLVWVHWLETGGIDASGYPIKPTTPEPHIIHEAWNPSDESSEWSKIDWYFWQQSAEFANQLFTTDEMTALRPYIESQFDDVVITPFVLPFSEAMRPMDTKNLPYRTIFKIGFHGATVRLNNCDFHCNVTGYFDADEYQEALAIAQVLPERPSPIPKRLKVQYNPDADAFYYVIETEALIYRISEPDFPSKEAAIEAAREYMF